MVRQLREIRSLGYKYQLFFPLILKQHQLGACLDVCGVANYLPQSSAVLFLDNLLLAQDRLAEAEFGFATAEVTYSLALINLKRAQGTLLQSERIEPTRIYDGQLPALILDSHKSRPEMLPADATPSGNP
jgi:hypothetical protein